MKPFSLNHIFRPGTHSTGFSRDSHGIILYHFISFYDLVLPNPRKILNWALEVGMKPFSLNHIFRAGTHSTGSSTDSHGLILIWCWSTPKGFWIRPRKLEWNRFLWIIFSGQGPIPQGLQQILMASFGFGAKEPQRDFGLDPGSWNETVFFESYFQGRDPFHRVFNRFSWPHFDLVLNEPQRDFGLDPGSWNETVFFESYFQGRDPFHRVFKRFSWHHFISFYIMLWFGATEP